MGEQPSGPLDPAQHQKIPADDGDTVGKKRARTVLTGVLVSIVLIFFISSVVATGDEENASTAGTSGAEEVSSSCTDAFETMRVKYNELYAQGDYTDLEANALEIPPLNACSSGAEWIAAGKANPAALGMTSSSAVDEMSLELRCNTTPNSVVCANK